MASGWDKVFEAPVTCQETTTTRRIKPNQVYEVGDDLTIIFQNSEEECMRVIVDTIGYGKINFSNQEFEEFLSTVDCFNTHWTDTFAIIGHYTLVFHHNGDKRSLKFEDADTDKYLFRWAEKILRLFCQHIYELYKLNCKWFPE